jgi:hypothetical protein
VPRQSSASYFGPPSPTARVISRIDETDPRDQQRNLQDSHSQAVLNATARALARVLGRQSAHDFLQAQIAHARGDAHDCRTWPTDDQRCAVCGRAVSGLRGRP